MRKLLEKAGLSFLRAFGSSLIVYAPGILSAPDLAHAGLVAAAAIVASLAAGFRALQEFVPLLSFATYIPGALGGYVDSFARAFLASLIASFASINAVPDLGTAKNIAVAALIGAVAAGLKVLQGTLTKGESPAPASGL